MGKIMNERPLCDYCGDLVWHDHYYEINGDVICPECMEGNFKKELEEE